MKNILTYKGVFEIHFSLFSIMFHLPHATFFRNHPNPLPPLQQNIFKICSSVAVSYSSHYFPYAYIQLGSSPPTHAAETSCQGQLQQHTATQCHFYVLLQVATGNRWHTKINIIQGKLTTGFMQTVGRL